ncbi:MAG: hypothetical protein V7695_09795 [Sulfitobacter sp.]
MSGFKYRKQKQVDRGCGAACVAMISGISFVKAENATQKNCTNNLGFVGIRNISKSLSDLKAPYQVSAKLTVISNKKIRDALKSTERSALVRTRKEGSVYHWMLWDGCSSRFLNPSDREDTTAKDFILYGYANLERVDHVLP